MALDPRVRRIVKVFKRLDTGSSQHLVDRRAAAGQFNKRFKGLVMPPGPPTQSTYDRNIEVTDGLIRIRIHRPHRSGTRPLHVFFHGGGWAVGTIDERDPRCRAIAAGADCVVASVEYRMAPENRYPTAPEDCYRALCWLVENAADHGIDPSRVSVGGESAGANLAAVVCLMARDRSGPQICYQWLDVPATDLTKSQPSFTEVADGLMLDGSAIDEYLDAYVDPDRRTEPYASPLWAESHSNLPPAWIMSCQHDKLRDDGVAYAEALAKAGVAVHHEVLAGHVHPSFAFTRLIPSAKDYENRAIAALGSVLWS